MSVKVSVAAWYTTTPPSQNCVRAAPPRGLLEPVVVNFSRVKVFGPLCMISQHGIKHSLARVVDLGHPAICLVCYSTMVHCNKLSFGLGC